MIEAAQAAAATQFGARAPRHSVQFYEAEPFLIERVGRFLADGFAAGDRLLVIATHDHIEALKHNLQCSDTPIDVLVACASGRIEFLDADETLAQLMVDGTPDPDRFHAVIGNALAAAPGKPQSCSRVYGEMVDLLWQRGQGEAALGIEALWNERQQCQSFHVMCAYQLSAFAADEGGLGFREVCCSHSHVLPTERVSERDDFESRQREICRLEQRSAALDHETTRRKRLEAALADSSQRHIELAGQLYVARAREQEAAVWQQAADRFRNELQRLVGWDLRGTLHSIVATSRLMILRGELLAPSEKRLARVVASGERMQRMLEQLLDVIEMRLAGRLVMEQPILQDIGLIVCRVADQVRVANPLRLIEVQIGEPCVAQVDGARIEQLLTTVIGNAVVHGDPDRVITVQLSYRPGQIRISVHNFGPPIAPDKVCELFEPEPRSSVSSARADGLGLGLQLARQIAEAHGGAIDVSSSELAGTCMRIRLAAP